MTIASADDMIKVIKDKKSKIIFINSTPRLTTPLAWVLMNVSISNIKHKAAFNPGFPTPLPDKGVYDNVLHFQGNVILFFTVVECLENR